MSGGAATDLWWAKRWRNSAAFVSLTLTEQGAYRNLVDEAVQRGGTLPNDEKLLAECSGDPHTWRVVRDAVMAHFTLEHDGWHTPIVDDWFAVERDE